MDNITMGHQRLHLGAGHFLWLLAGAGGGERGIRGGVGGDLSAGWCRNTTADWEGSGLRIGSRSLRQAQDKHFRIRCSVVLQKLQIMI